MSRTIDTDIDDDAGILGKVAAGRTDFDNLDTIQAARAVAGFTKVGNVVDPLLAAAEGDAETTKALAKYRRKFGIDLNYIASRNPGFKRELVRLKGNWHNKMTEATVSAGGAFAGMAAAGYTAATIAGAAVTGPVGWLVGIAGLMGGGLAADKIYHRLSPREAHNTVMLVNEIERTQRQGQQVNAGMVFDVLVDNARGKVGRKIRDRLESETGVRRFAEAAANPKNSAALNRIMRSSEYDVSPIIGGRLPAAEQFASWLNNGEMKAENLLDITRYMQNRQHRTLLAGSQNIVSPGLSLPSMPRSLLPKII